MLDKVEGVGKYVSCRQLVKRGNNSIPTLQLALFFAVSPRSVAHLRRGELS